MITTGQTKLATITIIGQKESPISLLKDTGMSRTAPLSGMEKNGTTGTVNKKSVLSAGKLMASSTLSVLKRTEISTQLKDVLEKHKIVACKLLMMNTTLQAITLLKGVSPTLMLTTHTMELCGSALGAQKNR
jgi:hypothetical protein